MFFRMAWWQIKPRELYFSHAFPDASSGLLQKTAALFVMVILGLSPCSILTPPLPPLPSCFVFDTCTGPNHYHVKRVGAGKCNVRVQHQWPDTSCDYCFTLSSRKGTFEGEWRNSQQYNWWWIIETYCWSRLQVALLFIIVIKLFLFMHQQIFCSEKKNNLQRCSLFFGYENTPQAEWSCPSWFLSGSHWGRKPTCDCLLLTLLRAAASSCILIFQTLKGSQLFCVFFSFVIFFIYLCCMPFTFIGMLQFHFPKMDLHKIVQICQVKKITGACTCIHPLCRERCCCCQSPSEVT